MMQRIIQLSGGCYHLIQEIGSGATATVWRVAKLMEDLKGMQEHAAATKTSENAHYADQRQDARRKDMALVKDGKTSAEILIQAPDRLTGEEGMASAEQRFMAEGQNIKRMSLQKKISETPVKPQYFALKTTMIDPLTPSTFKLQQQYNLELNLLRRLRHPGIIQPLDHGITQASDQLGGMKHKSTKKYLHMVTEWAPAGTLIRLARLIQEREHFNVEKDEILKYYCAQIVAILGYLQSMGISHRDIKAQNFVLDKDYKVKLIDFGSAEIVSPESPLAEFYKKEGGQATDKESRAYIGSKHYISPEMIRRSRQEKNELCMYTQSFVLSSSSSFREGKHLSYPINYSKTDIWSFGIFHVIKGVLIYYLYAREFPFEGKNSYYILDQIREGEVDYDKIGNEDVVMLLREIFKKNVEERADIARIKESQFFRGVDFDTIYEKESPLMAIVNNQGQKYFYQGEVIVRIGGEGKRRIIGLLSRNVVSSRSDKKQRNFILKREMSTKELEKQQSQNTAGSDKKLDSDKQVSQSGRAKGRKMYLTIAQQESNTVPKQLEIVKGQTKLQRRQASFVLEGLRFFSTRIQQPDSVELRFKSEEDMDLFFDGYKQMIAEVSAKQGDSEWKVAEGKRIEEQVRLEE